MDSTESRLIPLSGRRGAGKFAIVDASDYEWLSQRSWNLDMYGYAVATITISRGVKKRWPMHRLLVDLPPGMVTDHINRVKLDNRRSNLRVASRRLNRLNSPQSSPDPRIRRAALGLPHSNYGARGLPTNCSVWPERRHGRVRWRGCIDANSNRLYIRTCESEADAIAAVLALYIGRHGALPSR